MKDSDFNLETDLIQKDEDINRASEVLKAMSHPIRLKVLCSIRDKEVSVLEIVDLVGSSQSNISQHIDILRSKGIIESRREGNRILCRVSDLNILELISHMKTVFCKTV